jgi:DNA-directed RNA polymerase specialized sigma24 family protein
VVARCARATTPPGASSSTASRATSTRSPSGFRLSQQDAEDVFQEVFARVYERLESLREDEAVRP